MYTCNHKYYLLLLANYNELYQWSLEFYPDFWAEVWKYSGIVCSRLYDEVSQFMLSLVEGK